MREVITKVYNFDELFDEYCRNDNGAAVKNYLDDYIFAGGGVLA